MEWKYQVLFLHPPDDGHLNRFHLGPLWITLLWTLMCEFWADTGFHSSEVESLGHTPTLMFPILRNCFSKADASAHFPTSRACRLHLCTPLLTLVLSSGCKSCLTGVVTCISLTTKDVDQLFVCLLAICLPSLDIYLFKFLCPLFNWVMCLFHHSPFTD